MIRSPITSEDQIAKELKHYIGNKPGLSNAQPVKIMEVEYSLNFLSLVKHTVCIPIGKLKTVAQAPPSQSQSVDT